MSADRDSPVQTQMAVAAFRSSLGRSRIEGLKATGRRRVFVQTETGCVLGMELDRSDNAHMVKRRLQIALNVPFEESSLSFGDMVLNNDLSAVRNDSPLLFTRKVLHRSSSTPCLSPRDLQPKDQGRPVEILGHTGSFVRTKQLVDEVVNAIETGVEPVPVYGGLGGAYYFKNIKGESVAIVKPTDEEPFAPNNPKGFVGKALGQPGLKRSVRVGETGFREVAAYLLDYDHFANVPPTALVKITHSIFNVNDDVSGNINNNSKKIQRKKKLYSKIASLQQFIPHDFDASDHGTSSFPVSAVHRIGILDIRIFNTDRHAGNLLVRKVKNDDVGRFSEVELIPIDHGLCLPENLEDPYFEWIHWPQASIPFSEDELEYIEKLDPYSDADMLKTELPMIREACLRVLILCTIFLKEAASYGLCLAEIGEMMSREFRRGEEEPSELEVLFMEARKILSEKEAEMVVSPNLETEEDGFHFEIDCDESAFDVTPKFLNEPFVNSSLPFQFGYGRNPLSKLEEAIEEEESDEETDKVVIPASEVVPSVSKLSVSLKNSCSLGDNSWKTKAESNGFVAVNSSSGHKSANELLPAGATFATFNDMNEDEWGAFLEIFQDLIHTAFAKRKSIAMGHRQRQRLGTSCQF
ncbi:phosphatidylinositol 4-kinase gamma 7-like [Rutidosis leptorrhynchoides]|uniref:phosphatidylinositol 4-kinase gamma 7-like n=1 Tax=Rutidosis leptorrhynchoides TaxID=125765 RepID=UPI003A99B5B8